MDPDTLAPTVYDQSGPSHRLPVEILACILNFRFPEEGDFGRPQSDVAELYRLRMVSKLWKGLIEDTPTLWTNISTAYPTIVVQDCLRWSKNHLLRIRVFPTPSTSVKDLNNRLQLLQPHSHRWKTLAFSTKMGRDIDVIHIKDFLESPAPMLQSIYVNLSEFTSGAEVNLAGGKAEGLKHLTLHDGLLPGSSNLLRGLETLSIRLDDTVPEEDILNIFIKNPALRSFELTCSGAEQNNPTAFAPQPLETVATLLEEVTIHVTHPHITTRILSQISLPKCKSVELSADFTALGGDIHTLDDALAQFRTRIRETLSLGGRTTLLVLSESEFEWSSPLEDGGFRFSFGFSEANLSQLIEWIRRLGATLETPLELAVSITTAQRQTHETLGEWGEVTKLEIAWMVDPDEMDEVWWPHDFLGDPLVDPIGGLSWNFPNLRELDVASAEYDLLAIFGMLNKRYLPDAYVREMEGVGVSIRVPPKINLRVHGTTEGRDATVIEALKRHWGVRSLDQSEVDEEEFADE
ncbi:hypothetical protein FRC01_011784 [Tulasnella sp. 417]|nr:hypothetical protein FRC01_011784 [Tulasnella sp. 417]